MIIQANRDLFPVEEQETVGLTKPPEHRRRPSADVDLHGEDRADQQSDVDHGPCFQIHKLRSHILDAR